jgi:dolichyl-phosphate beta-glucosyltransferase
MSECVIVVPCYNEAQRLDLGAFVEHAVRGEESFLFVNDGSTDATGQVLDDLCSAVPASLSVLHLEANGGKAEAVRQGVLQAFTRRPRYIGYWDADLATPLAAIGQFRTYLHDHPQVELLLGARIPLLGRRIERRASRQVAGRLFAACASRVLNLPVNDTQCGAKLFRATPRLQAAFAEPFRSRWIFDVELLARLLTAVTASGEPSAAESIHELPLDAWRDVAGSKLRAGDFLRAALQLADIHRQYRPSRRPQKPAEPLSPVAVRPVAPVSNRAEKSSAAPAAKPTERSGLEPVR